MIEEEGSLHNGTTEQCDRYYFNVELADKVIEIECMYKETFAFFCDYVSNKSNVDNYICTSKQEILSEAETIRAINKSTIENSEAIATNYVSAEIAVVFKKVSEQLLNSGILLIHGAAISLDNKSYIFTAPSGTGKTTHIMNWKKQFKDTVIINGDKPFVNTNSKLVYGTPWCGKENMNTNTSSPLSGIILLERGTVNSIKPIEFKEILPSLLQQTYIPTSYPKKIQALRNIERLKTIPCYHLQCNLDEEAADVAYSGIKSSEPTP